MNIPNTLTLLRVALVPIFVLVFLLPYQWSYAASAVIFGIAGITDALDGYLARKLNQTTKLGAFLDPVADKLMVAVALVFLVYRYNDHWLFAVAASIIIGREIVISALREWMAELGARASVAVSNVGKVKTAMQIISIIVLLLISPTSPQWMIAIGYALMISAAVLTLWSGAAYLKAAYPSLREDP